MLFSYLNPSIQILHSNQEHLQLSIGPIERHFAMTMGNLLRKIALRMSYGMATTAFTVEAPHKNKFNLNENVKTTSLRSANRFHEFQNIPGVKEDLSDIGLNIKSIVYAENIEEKYEKQNIKKNQFHSLNENNGAVTNLWDLFRNHPLLDLDKINESMSKNSIKDDKKTSSYNIKNFPSLVYIKKKAPAIITAGDIYSLSKVSPKVVNKDLVICHFEQNPFIDTLLFTLVIDIGVGYLPASYHSIRNGFIPLDAVFSPVRNISFYVRRYNIYEELFFDIQTNASCHPMDVLTHSLRFLRSKFDLTINPLTRHT